MGRACDMPSDVLPMPTFNPQITVPPDENPATVSHTHIRKLSFPDLTKYLFSFFYLFSKCARNIQKYCSNENSCVCFMGYSGYDCSQVEPTIQPPPIRRTASPPDNTPPSVDKSHSTPTNTYIRKSIISVPHQKISHTEKNGTCKMHVFISYLLFGGERFLSRYVRKRIQEVDGLLISIFRLSNCQERTYHF